MEYLIETQFSSGIVIASSQWFDSLSEELVYSFEIISDVEGKTCLAADYLGQDWKKIWSSHAKYLINLCNSGVAAMLLFREGTYLLKIERDCVNYNNSVHFANLKVESDIYWTELDPFLVDYSSKDKHEEFEEIKITPGLYELCCSFYSVNDFFLIKLLFKRVNSFESSKIKKILYI